MFDPTRLATVSARLAALEAEVEALRLTVDRLQGSRVRARLEALEEVQGDMFPHDDFLMAMAENVKLP